MASANIEINGVAASDDDLPIDTLVSLDNANTGGELTFAWAILDKPPGSLSVLSSSSIQAPTFTPDSEGTYLLELVVNATLPSEVRDRKIVGIRQLKTRSRVPAAGETTEAGARGWAGASGSLLQLLDVARADPGFVVGVTGVPALNAGNTVRCTDVAVLKLGLPGEESVPSFDLADATAAANVDEAIGVIASAVDGSGGPYASGTIVLVRTHGLFLGVSGVGAVAGDPVYVSDLGTLDLVPGTNSRQIGSVAAARATDFDVWFEGGLIGAGGGATTLAGAYLNGAAAAHQTLLINAVDGGPVIFKANGAATGTLVEAQSSAAASLFAVADNAQAYLSGSAANAGTNKGVVLDARTTLTTAARPYLSVQNGSTQQWGFYTLGTGERVIEATAGTDARLYGNGTLVVGDTALETTFLRLNSVDAKLTTTVGQVILTAASGGTVATTTQADGAGAIGLDVDTVNAWSNATAKLQRWRTNASERLAVLASSGAILNPSTAILRSGIADAGANVGVATDTVNILTVGRHYFEARTGGTAQWAMLTGAGGEVSIEAVDGTQSQLLGNSDLFVADGSALNSYLRLRATAADVVTPEFAVTSQSISSIYSTDADGASALILQVDTTASWTNAGAKLQMWKNNAVEKFAVMASGQPRWSEAGNVQTTVGAAGGASALPITPTKYLKVQDDGGNVLVVPAYDQA